SGNCRVTQDRFTSRSGKLEIDKRQKKCNGAGSAPQISEPLFQKSSLGLLSRESERPFVRSSCLLHSPQSSGTNQPAPNVPGGNPLTHHARGCLRLTANRPKARPASLSPLNDSVRLLVMVSKYPLILISLRPVVE